MMRTIVDKVSQLFQKAGLYIQIHYLPTEKDIYRYLKNRPLVIQFYELKKMSNFIRLNKNHTLYNKLLNMFVPGWNLNFKKAIFMSEGQGSGNINIYRKVELKDKDGLLFEKVYYSPSYHSRRNLWFYRNVYKLIKDKIKTAAIIKLFSNELFTIIYFQYLGAKKHSGDKIQYYMIENSKQLYQASLKESS